MDLYGPDLPPGYVRSDEDDSEQEEVQSTTNNSSKVIGPQIPAFLSRKLSKDNDSEPTNSDSRNVIGPALPPSFAQANHDDGEFDDDDCYGPMPPPSNTDVHYGNDRKSEIEKRAVNMKNKLDNKYVPVVDTVQREEWMTVPDTSRKNQLGAISRCLAPTEASSSSSSKGKHHHSHRHSETDKKTTEELKKYNKSRRSESLLEMHKKSKKKKEKDRKESKSERKPFDRDEMAVRSFTKDQVNTVIDKAKYLNSRFAPSKASQYL